MRRTAVACAALLVIAGCSASPDRFADARALADAAIAATAAGHSARFTTDVTAGAVVSHGQGEAAFGPAGTALRMTTDYLGEPLELRLVAQKLYAKVPSTALDQVTDHKPWVQVSPDGSDPFSQVLGGSLAQLAEQNDPARTLDQVRTAGTLASSDPTTLDGTDATHYRVDVDLAHLGSQLPAGLPADAITQLGGTGTKVPLDLWLDSDDRPLQLVLDLSPALHASGAQTAARITAHYSDWGTPITVAAPAADEVGTFLGG
ncbi:hypothetical protein VSH64_29260 [Amycolatopsis rhabdoformis]|uniref:LppX_LprAFG lipoprotein n=1 Tax=Amycolatopsis rhabdoformis TaxID=1448059 RepID=A0ABZ1HXV0_9PSEU|nr:hypothetical protein [Amycolatopsis rhabdoformis]WSE26953.1 hypothetical protein VSH64_29260 [Amycolatopsis rhabdoformis]